MSARVLNNYELLEEILLHLPLRYLLLAQKVSRRFHAIINDSLNIQQALFMKPTSASSIEEGLITDPPGCGRFIRIDWRTCDTLEATIVIANPFMDLLADFYDPKRYPGDEFDPPSLRDRADDTCFEIKCSRGQGHRRSSLIGRVPKNKCLICRNRERPLDKPSFTSMLVCDPPATHMITYPGFRDAQTGLPTGRIRLVLSSRNGIRFGKICASLDEHAGDTTGAIDAFLENVKLWRCMPKSVDYLTGWESLRVLNSLGEKRMEESILWSERLGEWGYRDAKVRKYFLAPDWACVG